MIILGGLVGGRIKIIESNAIEIDKIGVIRCTELLSNQKHKKNNLSKKKNKERKKHGEGKEKKQNPIYKNTFNNTINIYVT